MQIHDVISNVDRLVSSDKFALLSFLQQSCSFSFSLHQSESQLVHWWRLSQVQCCITNHFCKTIYRICKPVATTFCTLSLNGDKMLFIYVSGQFGRVSCVTLGLECQWFLLSSLHQGVLSCVGGKSWHWGLQTFIRYSKYFWDFNCLAGSWMLF